MSNFVEFVTESTQIRQSSKNTRDGNNLNINGKITYHH